MKQSDAEYSESQELLELVDETGCLIGLAPRSRCHGDPSLAHRTVHILVANRAGQIYLQKRSMSKDIQPGKWDSSVGGHLMPGESYLSAAVRELREELGITLYDSGELKSCHDYVWRTEVETEYIRTFRMEHEGPFFHPEEEIEEGRFWAQEEISAAFGTGQLTPNLEMEIKLLRSSPEGN